MRANCALFSTILVLTMISPSWARHPSTLKNQQNYERVREARANTADDIAALFEEAQIGYPPRAVFLRAFKAEGLLELWAKGADGEYVLIKYYDVCMASGEPGPKRRSGDYQVPEGVYQLNRFNPLSRFHLSLGLNYPNKSDRVRGVRGALGGDIFIHGNCVTVGCLPITDVQIEELYVISIDAKDRRVPVHLFPARMDSEAMEVIEDAHPEHRQFWAELYPIYLSFERTHRLPRVRIGRRGAYQIRPSGVRGTRRSSKP